MLQQAGVSAGMPISLLLAGPAFGKQIVSCGGAVLLGGAQLLCSHVDPSAPAQICTYSWALATPANQTQVVEGSFLIAAGDFEPHGLSRRRICSRAVGTDRSLPGQAGRGLMSFPRSHPRTEPGVANVAG